MLGHSLRTPARPGSPARCGHWLGLPNLNLSQERTGFKSHASASPLSPPRASRFQVCRLEVCHLKFTPIPPSPHDDTTLPWPILLIAAGQLRPPLLVISRRKHSCLPRRRLFQYGSCCGVFPRSRLFVLKHLSTRLLLVTISQDTHLIAHNQKSR